MTDRKVITGATAFNEMAILEREGKAGSHLVDFGPWRLVLEPSESQWEHLRLVFASPQVLRVLQESGWVVVGNWFAFTYLKRRTDTPAAPA